MTNLVLHIPQRERYAPANASTVHIAEVKDSAGMQAFIDFPYQLYKDNPFYLPTLKADTKAAFDAHKNPAFDFCTARYWLGYKEGKLAGRIAGIINHAVMEQWGERYMRFGWIDFIDDAAVAHALIHTVERWAMQENMKAVHGPLGFTNFDHAGLLIEGFDEPASFAAMYNHPYYATHLQSAGYEKETDWVEYKIRVPSSMPPKIKKLAEIVARRYRLRMVKARSKKEIAAYAPAIFKLMNKAYEGLFGMVPLTQRQIDYSIRKYFSMVKPEYVSLVLDEHDELAAFGIAMPSLTAAMQKAKGKLFPLGIFHIIRAFRHHSVADLALVAVRPDLQGKGVNALLMHHMAAAFIKAGVQYAESNPELETNSKVQSQWALFEKRQHKRRRCFIHYLQA